ncbi:MAG: WecB/TagA/CpsF family glycosyltransferase [Actinobacteria bacterium]|nr:WecB/TagA/CpsF family glycosyltransferase [Actinomycetota bacterium]
MTDRGKRSVLGVLVDVVDYDAAVERTVAAARNARPFAVSALAVHGVMTGVLDPEQRFRLNRLDLVVPDGRPVRFALNLVHRARLDDQVRGTTFVWRLLERAADERLPVFFYGSRPDTLSKLEKRVLAREPHTVIAGIRPSLFGEADSAAQDRIVAEIAASGARLVFVGLGCPRQEVFVSELRERVGVPMLAVGAAFDYIAGSLREPPDLLREWGLEWLWRLALEPGRLWRRYITLNPAFVALLALQALRLWRPDATGVSPEPLERLEA